MSMRTNMKLSFAAMLAGSAVLVAACGGSGAGLIPEGNAGPLRSDFEAVASAAESGNGDCSHTQAALARTEADFNRLPSSVSPQLRTRLSEGISHLNSQALLACKQPSGAGTATTTATTKTTTSKTTPPPTSTTTTTTTTTASEEEPVTTSSTSSSTSTPVGPVGGAEAPSEGAEGNPGGSQAEGELEK